MTTVYSFATPSLDGVLTHDALIYEGIERPAELLRALDRRPENSGRKMRYKDRQNLERYFFDLYGAFLRKFSAFAIDGKTDPEEILKLQAILQEMIKIKKRIERAP